MIRYVVKKKINNKYKAAHFGKWGMGSSPSVLGYDTSDGPTKNKDGNFNNNKSQWQNTTKKDPKNIFSLTDPIPSISNIRQSPSRRISSIVGTQSHLLTSDKIFHKLSAEQLKIGSSLRVFI